jgi:uncharacterized membrane protein YbhN (UPF0104 family)
LARKLNKIAVFALKLMVSSGLLYLVLSKAGIDKVLSLLLNINPLSFIFAVLVYIFAQFISSFRWKLLLPEGFSVRTLFPLYLIGSFFNTFLPGLVGGDAIKAYYLYKKTGEGAQTLASVFMDRYVGYVTLMIIGLIAYPFGAKHIKGSWIEWLLPLIVLCFALGSFIVLGLRLGKRVKFLNDIYSHFHFYRRKKGVVAKTILLSAVIQCSVIFAVYLLARGLGVELPLYIFFVFIPIIVTVSAMPVSLSGIGLREASFALLFSSVGVNTETATAISFAWFLSLVVGGLAGLYEYLKYKKHAS